MGAENILGGDVVKDVVNHNVIIIVDGVVSFEGLVTFGKRMNIDIKTDVDSEQRGVIVLRGESTSKCF